jgi:hypothetical protein
MVIITKHETLQEIDDQPPPTEILERFWSKAWQSSAGHCLK